MRTNGFLFTAISGLIWLSVNPICGGQAGPVAKKTESPTKHSQLALVTKLVVKSEMARSFVDPMTCDQDGNLYLITQMDAVSGIRKLNAKGERMALFVGSAATDLQVQVAGYFSVAPNGGIYQLAYLRNTVDRAMLVFKNDGTLRSGIKLQPGFSWTPTQVAAFSSGDVLVAGMRDDTHVPFTGIFDSTGTLRKQVILADDEEIQAMVADGRAESGHRYGNRAVELGQMEKADDGNVYLMRRLSSPILYAISPRGEVVKRFVVDAGSADFIPDSMHIAGGRIAILFREPQTREKFVRILDLNGKKLATYYEPMEDGRGILGNAFACYSDNPERFTFLYTSQDGNLGFKIAEPR